VIRINKVIPKISTNNFGTSPYPSIILFKISVERITIPTLTKLIEISNKAINSLGFESKSRIIFEILEFSDFKRSFSFGLREKKADSDEVVIAANTNRTTIIEV
jgi:hypothetical protein